jgi:hypothetical protein
MSSCTKERVIFDADICSAIQDTPLLLCNPKVYYCVGFEVLAAVSTKMAVFWFVAPCSLVEVYQRFRGPCRLHHPDDGGSKDLFRW